MNKNLRLSYIAGRLLHLTSQQKAAIETLLNRFQAQRPTPQEYETALNSLHVLGAVSVPRFRKGTTPFPQTRPGYEVGEVVPSDKFEARHHLPPGLGLYSMYDSGGNCRVSSAAAIAWTAIWNCWPSRQVRDSV
jgi:hypothetical protein